MHAYTYHRQYAAVGTVTCNGWPCMLELQSRSTSQQMLLVLLL
jgi:hypothetical protein